MAGRVVADITMSLDGFVAGPNDGPELPLGEGGERLHEWVYGLESWRKPHGLSGGETSRDSEILDELMEATGAIVVGRRMFDNARGWGDTPPFHEPVFVLTHETRPAEAKEGGTTFTFVTDGVEGALEQARAAAGDKDVGVGGGASTIGQFIEAGLLDELQVHIAPLLLGGGIRLFEGVRSEGVQLERTRVIDSPAVTHVRFRIVR
ncbi:MAG: dihydrofolate reductase family protein [Actinobacteria bacterium]|nr:dihydrofolate reductase family protein [Actinomycetota bacterium]